MKLRLSKYRLLVYHLRAFEVSLLITPFVSRESKFSQLLEDIKDGKAKQDSSKYDQELLDMFNSGKVIETEFLRIVLTAGLYKSAEYMLEQMGQEEKDELLS